MKTKKVLLEGNYNLIYYKEQLEYNLDDSVQLYFNNNPTVCFDLILVFNYLKENISVLTHSETKIILIFSEPGNFFLHPFMYFGNIKSSKLQNINFKNKNLINNKDSIPYTPFHVSNKLNNLFLLNSKKNNISAIYSKKSALKGHRLRLSIIEKLHNLDLKFDSYGKGHNPILSKSDGLISYRYSICIENDLELNLFTEKIMDCFLCLTVPIYVGCSNIYSFFPKNSIVVLNPNLSNEEIINIFNNLDEDDYKSRLKALKIAKQKCLDDYSISSLISRKLDGINNSGIQNIQKLSKYSAFVKIVLHSIHKLSRILYQ